MSTRSRGRPFRRDPAFGLRAACGPFPDSMIPGPRVTRGRGPRPSGLPGGRSGAASMSRPITGPRLAPYDSPPIPGGLWRVPVRLHPLPLRVPCPRIPGNPIAFLDIVRLNYSGNIQSARPPVPVYGWKLKPRFGKGSTRTRNKSPAPVPRPPPPPAPCRGRFISSPPALGPVPGAFHFLRAGARSGGGRVRAGARSGGGRVRGGGGSGGGRVRGGGGPEGVRRGSGGWAG